MNENEDTDQTQALILFVREPKLGEVKTRLARTVGEEKALSLYRRMLEQLRKTSVQVDADRWVFFDREPEEDPFEYWPKEYFQVRIQKGNDLGERMHRAIQFLLEEKQYDKAMLTGSDCPSLTSDILHRGFTELDDHDVVLGPSTDGGYYLIGMKEVIRSIFYHIPWSTEVVRSLTEDRLRQNDLSRYLLPELTDMDTEEDLEKWNKEDGVEG